jgi:hypothetical protein
MKWEKKNIISIYLKKNILKNNSHYITKLLQNMIHCLLSSLRVNLLKKYKVNK